ncbi:MAG: Spy/CpxP family protein refolding chaperone [Rhodomicrobium sp.]
MKKTIIAGLTALALVGTSMTYAQQAPDAGAKHEHHHMSPADMKAFTDARIAALKAGLELTPDQEKNWAPVEAAIRAMAEARQARWAARREHAKTEDAIAKLRARADAMTQRAADLKKLADAAEPLYRSLSDEQKHRLHFLMHMMMHHGHHGGWGHHGGEEHHG